MGRRQESVEHGVKLGTCVVVVLQQSAERRAFARVGAESESFSPFWELEDDVDLWTNGGWRNMTIFNFVELID